MTRRRALFFSACAPLAAQQATTNAAESQVRWSPRPVFNGAPVLFRSQTYSGPATWMGKTIEFRSEADGFSALAGVNLDTPPGPCELAFGGEVVSVPVTARAYRTSTITVPSKFVEPPKETLARIDEEREIKKKVFASSPAERLWQGRFTAPANTRFTSSFGVRRTYNGKTQSVHQGLDYSAAMGTTIHAANFGRVALVHKMYFEGGFIVIDHGDSFFTLYMHLSEFLVKEGTLIQKGTPIAKSGASGRVTGPHLHFAAQWQGTYVEPATLLQL